jgi:NifU-like protein involved in Fe-S cluster formation
MVPQPEVEGTTSRQVTGHAGNPPGQGPFIAVTLVVEGDFVRRATYETYQCPGCHACGKAVCDLVTGKSLTEAHAVNWDVVAQRVGPLAKHRQICYGLAVVALAEALRHLGKAEVKG